MVAVGLRKLEICREKDWRWTEVQVQVQVCDSGFLKIHGRGGVGSIEKPLGRDRNRLHA